MVKIKQDDDKIVALSEYCHISLRLEMYLGSRSNITQNVLVYENDGLVIKELTWTPAVLTAFREALDNACDIVIVKKTGDRIDISYDENTHIVNVHDYGKGISLAYDEENKMYGPTLALTRLRSGTNFDDKNRTGAGMNGLGISCVVNTSEFFNVTVKREHKRFIQHYKRGKDALIMDEPKIIDITSDETGTEIEYKLSDEVFPNQNLPLDLIKTIIYEIACNNPKIKFYFNGEKIKTDIPEKLFFKNFKTAKISIKEDDFRSEFYLVPKFHKEKDDFNFSLTNNIPLFNSGSHIDTFKSGMFSGLMNELKNLWKKEKLEPKKADLQEGLLIYNITQLKAPFFDSQSKTRLINEDILPIIKKYINNYDWKKFIKQNSEWIGEIKNRVLERTEVQNLKDLQKQQKKNLKRSIPKLRDANSRKRNECSLFLCEGDSAMAGGLNVRNPQIHAFMTLGGKVPNVYDLSPLKIHESEKLSNIMAAIGLCIGEKADREKLRYGHVYIATDMDSDGSAIASELINFFHKFWPELFDKEDPFLRIFMSPFIIAEKGKDIKYWYLDNIDEFKDFDCSGWHITRAKGLGTLNKKDWDNCINNIRYIPVIDNGNFAELNKLIFKGDLADKRKMWMTESGEDMSKVIKNGWEF